MDPDNPSPTGAAPTFTRLELTDLFKIAENLEEIPWQPFKKGVDIHRLYGDGVEGPSAALIRFREAGVVSLHEHTGYEHILVLAGSQRDANGIAETGTLTINAPGTRHRIVSETGCVVLAIYEKPVRLISEDRASSAEPMKMVPLAVNGTLMRGLELNPNLIEAGAEFLYEDVTEPAYRLFSIGDRHPGMYRVTTGGAAIAVEVWAVPPAGFASILLKEPPGLSIGKVLLSSGAEVLGVLAEPILCASQREITQFAGWRNYLAKDKNSGVR